MRHEDEDTEFKQDDKEQSHYLWNGGCGLYYSRDFLKSGHGIQPLEGLLVPLCMYVILAVSLNLTVGISGELSLGHAGFMCVGAFASAFFSRCMETAIPVSGIRFFLAILIGTVCAALFGILIGIRFCA